MIYKEYNMSDNVRKNKEAISKLDQILQELSSKRVVDQKKLNMFYGYLETMYDEDLQKVEDIMLNEKKKKNKQEKIVKLINVITE